GSGNPAGALTGSLGSATGAVNSTAGTAATAVAAAGNAAATAIGAAPGASVSTTHPNSTTTIQPLAPVTSLITNLTGALRR
ncbi:hypothetical protein KR98_22870, partial [Ralstonia solanacearum]